MARKTSPKIAGAPRGHLLSVYERLKTDIINLAFRPGQDLDETSLSRRYGVSRTPIRETLIRLAGERLVEIGRNRGARVTQLIISDLPRYFEALDFVRRAASHLAAQRRTPSDMKKIEEARTAYANAVRGREQIALSATEKEFDVAVAEAGHNSYVTEHYAGLLTVGLRMMRIPYGYELKAGPSMRDYCNLVSARHKAMIAAIEAQDADAAERIAHEATQGFRDHLRAYFDENLLTGVTVKPADE